jgi:UDP-glucose 4-epimerase
MGTFNVLECVRDSGATIAFASSSSVYGANSMLPKIEEMWTAPLTPYAASKLAAEALVRSYAESYSIKAITYRFFNIFGPWQRPDHEYAAVIPKWISKLLRNEEIEIYGDGNQSRDFTYVDDIVQILLTGIETQLNHPGPINLAFGSHISLNEIVEIFLSWGKRVQVRYLPERLGDVKYSQNNPKIMNELFHMPKRTEFEIALQATWEWI